MFTKNFYRRLWRHWLPPVVQRHFYPSAMFGMPATGEAFISSQGTVANNTYGGMNYDSFGCGTGPVTIYTSPASSGEGLSVAQCGQYFPSSEATGSNSDTNYNIGKLTLTETAYNENTFYDQIVANTPISNLTFTTRTAQSDSDSVYDSTTDSIKKTYSYTVTNNGTNAVTVRALSGTKCVYSRQTELGSDTRTYLLIWGINLDNPVEILTGESATLTITYRWNNCTPGSQASPYSISASIE